MAKKQRSEAQKRADKRRSARMLKENQERREKEAQDAAIDEKIAELAEPAEDVPVPDANGRTFIDKQKRTTAGVTGSAAVGPVVVGQPLPVDVDTELRPEFTTAVNRTMELLEPVIIYEQDAPEEARIVITISHMHLKQEDITAQVLQMYNPAAEIAFDGSLEDLKLIVQGIEDSISILKKRTEDAFPTPGERPLNDLELTALSELAWTEAATFYRVQPEDCLRGYIAISSRHAMRVNHPPGTRSRQWISVQTFAKMFIDVLADDTVDDMVMALIEADEQTNRGYAPYLLRWREAGLI